MVNIDDDNNWLPLKLEYQFEVIRTNNCFAVYCCGDDGKKNIITLMRDNLLKEYYNYKDLSKIYLKKMLKK